MRVKELRGFFQHLTAGLLLVLVSPFAQANLVIEITEGYENAIPIAVVPFNIEGRGAAPVDLGSIIQNNLRRSGRFAPIDNTRLPQQPTQFEGIVFDQWQGF